MSDNRFQPGSSPEPRPQFTGQPSYTGGTPPTPPGFDPPAQAGWNQPPPAWQAGPPVPPTVPPVIPFHPITVGTLFSGMFKAVKANAKSMFLISFLVMAIVGLISGLMTIWLPSSTAATAVVESPLQSAVSIVVDLATPAAGLLLSGFLVLSVINSVVGRNLSLASLWSQLKPNFGVLIATAVVVWLTIAGVMLIFVSLPFALSITAVYLWGFSEALVVVMTILYGIGAAVLGVFLSVRLFFATMVAVVEGVGPITAIEKSWALSKDAFWRIVGRVLLITLVVGVSVAIISGIVALPFLFLLASAPVWITTLVTTFLGSIIAGLGTPFSSSYSSLMFLDERIRKENLAPQLEAEWKNNLSAEGRMPYSS